MNFYACARRNSIPQEMIGLAVLGRCAACGHSILYSPRALAEARSLGRELEIVCNKCADGEIKRLEDEAKHDLIIAALPPSEEERSAGNEYIENRRVRN